MICFISLYYKYSAGILQTVYLGSSSLEFTKGAVFFQHGDAAIRMGPTGRADARKNRETPGGGAFEGQGSPGESHPGQT